MTAGVMASPSMFACTQWHGIQLDQMTQQNSALVEQSAAAAASLREQASGLAASVAAFKLT